MERPIEEILSEEPEVIETEELEITDPPSGIADTPSRLRDDKGRFASQDETGVETPPAEAAAEPGPPPVQDRLPQAEFAALKDERTKRQQLEERLRQYDEYFAQLQAQPNEAPDMFADPDAHTGYVIEQAVAKAIEKLQPTIQQGHLMTNAQMSEMLARTKYDDYDATVEEFKEALAANPFLLTQLQQAPDMATFAYNAGKQWQAAKSFGTQAQPNPDDVRAQMREEIIAELGLSRPQAPSTLADGRSVGGRSGPAWSGPKPISEILGR